jgi:hypothetical protein
MKAGDNLGERHFEQLKVDVGVARTKVVDECAQRAMRKRFI